MGTPSLQKQKAGVKKAVPGTGKKVVRIGSGLQLVYNPKKMSRTEAMAEAYALLESELLLLNPEIREAIEETRDPEYSKKLMTEKQFKNWFQKESKRRASDG